MLRSLNEEINFYSQKNNNSITLIGGDFNLPDIDWPNNVIKSNSRDSDSCRTLLSIIQRNSLNQIVIEPTRETRIFDLLLINTPERILNSTVCDGLSDHKDICIDLNVNVTRHRKPKRKVYIYSKADFEGFQNHLVSDFPIYQSYTTSLTVKETWNLFIQKMRELIDKFVPSKFT